MTPEEVGFEGGHLLIVDQHAEGAPGAGESRHGDCLFVILFVCFNVWINLVPN